MAKKSFIQLNQLHYQTPHNQTIIKDVSLSFGVSKIAIIGRNGIGKSTLLKLIVGELFPSSGSVLVECVLASS